MLFRDRGEAAPVSFCVAACPLAEGDQPMFRGGEIIEIRKIKKSKISVDKAV